MNKKVKFKPEILKLLKNDPDYHKGHWVSISFDRGEQAYNNKFDVPYFIIDYRITEVNYSILYPDNLKKWLVNKSHVIPYEVDCFTLDDELFEL